MTVGHLVYSVRESAWRHSAWRRCGARYGAARVARWLARGAGVIVIGCGGNAGTDSDAPSPAGSDATEPASGDAPSPAGRASLLSADECVWMKVTECNSRIEVQDWCGAGFYAATLQRCPDAGGSTFRASGIYPSLQLSACRPDCISNLMHISLDAIECCPDGVPGTPVPDE